MTGSQRELMTALHDASQLDTPAARAHRRAWAGDWWSVTDLHRFLVLRISMTPGIAHRAGKRLHEAQLVDRRKHSGVIYYRLSRKQNQEATS
jgi:hypothetical protein